MQGQFIKENRPSFSGMISNDCIGYVIFQNQYLSFKYYQEEYKIILGNQQTGEVWNKGNNFSILVFIQVKSKLKKSWNRPWKKIIQFWKRSSQFSFTRQNEKIKTLYGSKKIYNTKYIDNRTMQRLHKWIDELPFLILLFDVHWFCGGMIYFLHFNFSTKTV